MRVGFSAGIFKGTSGVDTYILNLLKHLHGIDLVLFISERQKLLAAKGIKTCFNKDFFSSPLLHIFWHNAFLPRLLKEENIDLLHIPTIRRIPLRKTVPFVVTVHDLAPLLMPEKYGRLRHAYFKYCLPSLVRSCERIIAVSQATKQDLIRNYSIEDARIDVIYSGIDHTIFYPKQEIPRSKPFILFVSRIEHPAKNHLRLIKAFEKWILPKYPHDLFFIGADWRGAEMVKNYVKERNLQERVQFKGFVPSDKIADYYSACDLFVFPSLFEGFGFPVLEAMACGARVVCSGIPIMREVANDYAEFFDPYSEEAIGKVIKSCLDQREDPTRKSRIAYTKQFTWERSADETLKVYKSAF